MMDTMGLSEQQRHMLQERLPARCVKERDGGGGRKLSYVDTFYVITRMNEVFGPAWWSYEAIPTLIWEGQVKDKYACAYRATCTLKLGLPTSPYCVITDTGSGDGRDVYPPSAHELASKEACTDALKRCCKSLGNSLGLALYDKEQEHVITLEEEVRDLTMNIRAAADQSDLALARARASLMKPALSKEQALALAAEIASAKERLGVK